METIKEIMEKQRSIIGLCPRCKSNRTGQTGKQTHLIMSCIVIFVGACLSVVFLPLGILGIIGGIGLLMITPFVKTLYNCQDCKLSWKPGENPFPETNQ